MGKDAQGTSFGGGLLQAKASGQTFPILKKTGARFLLFPILKMGQRIGIASGDL